MPRRVACAQAEGDYPLLSGGDVNLYSLFVERANKLVKPAGMIGLLTPSGIASDKTAAPFFKGVSTAGRLKALYDFENRRTGSTPRPFFPTSIAASNSARSLSAPCRRTFEAARCAFFLQDVSELQTTRALLSIRAKRDFAQVNPNTGTAPISAAAATPPLQQQSMAGFRL